MASSIIQWKYDVFLSFRGEDTRKNFTDHLYTALDKKGIFTFRDDEQLEKGKEISSELLRSIEESRFSIIVLSKNYASSTWCLEELAKIVECMEMKIHTALPVFYDVDPSNVRKLTGDFKKAFDKHEEDKKEKVQRWRSALKQVADLSGWHLQDRHESELIRTIVHEISRRLESTHTSVAKDLVGMESRVNEMKKYLEVGLQDVRFIGICGMGGIGKTTLVRVLYEMLANQYECSSFLANVREVSEKGGLLPLQEQLLSEILMERNFKLWDVHKGINLIRRRLCRKRVLVVIDDVDQLEQLETLAGKHDWFGSGSRIMITTTDEHLLVSHGVKDIYNVPGLNRDESLQLFHLKAFKHKQPTNDHVHLLNHFVNYAHGLPLALEVLGSSLCDRSVQEWKSALDRLQEIPDGKILKVLRISYDALIDIEKKIFLDVACFFKGKDKDRVIKILDGCRFYPDIGLRVLVEKSLVTISNNKLWMHDLLQIMGWEIVREQHPNEPGKWSRLWQSKNIYHVLTKHMGTPAVEGIVLDIPKQGITHLNGKSFSNMSSLRVLKISKVHLSEDLEYLSNELRFLKWCGYPLSTLPLSFHPEKLFELNMCYSRIKYLWEGIKPFEQLKTIKLSHSCSLTRTPDFTEVPNLEQLNLEGCTGLLEVHQSVGVLKRLIVLNLKNCKNLVSFPSSVCGLKSLKILNLYGCSKLAKLPQNLGEVICLEELDVSGTAIRQVPPSIVGLTNLKTLSLHGCKGQPPQTWRMFFQSLLMPRRNPDSICLLLHSLKGLCSLTTLDLSDCNVLEGEIPSDIGSLHSLQELNLSGNNFVNLPESMSQLSKLRLLYVEKCERLQSLPALPSGIVSVSAKGCTSLEALSDPLKLSNAALFEFFNCFKLVENQERKDSLTAMLLKCRLQEIFIQYNQFRIQLPGSEIPKWFSYWSKGPSIKMRLPLHWLNDNFMGFAVCAVASPEYSDELSRSICCTLRILTRSRFDFCFAMPGFTKSDHLSVDYFSRNQFGQQSEWLSTGRYVEVRFDEVNGLGKTKWIVNKCGIRLVYKQDVESFGVHHNFEELTAEKVSLVEQDHDEEETSESGDDSKSSYHSCSDMEEKF